MNRAREIIEQIRVLTDELEEIYETPQELIGEMPHTKQLDGLPITYLQTQCKKLSSSRPLGNLEIYLSNDLQNAYLVHIGISRFTNDLTRVDTFLEMKFANINIDRVSSLQVESVIRNTDRVLNIGGISAAVIMYLILIENSYQIVSGYKQYIPGKSIWKRLANNLDSDNEIVLYDSTKKQYVGSYDPTMEDKEIWSRNESKMYLILVLRKKES